MSCVAVFLVPSSVVETVADRPADVSATGNLSIPQFFNAGQNFWQKFSPFFQGISVPPTTTTKKPQTQ
jgi:hypothetical protein